MSSTKNSNKQGSFNKTTKEDRYKKFNGFMAADKLDTLAMATTALAHF